MGEEHVSRSYELNMLCDVCVCMQSKRPPPNPLLTPKPKHTIGRHLGVGGEYQLFFKAYMQVHTTKVPQAACVSIFHLSNEMVLLVLCCREHRAR